MPRIAIDCREFDAGRMTGIGRLLLNLVPAACALRPGWEFLLLSCKPDRIPFGLPAGARILRLNMPWQLCDQLELPRLLRAEGCSLYYSPYPKAPLWGGIPSVVTIHDLIWLEYPGYARFRQLQKLFFGSIAVRAAAVLTVSDFSRGEVLRAFGVPEAKVHTCYPAVDSGYFAAPASSRAACLGELEGNYLLYVGNARPHKNLERLLAAAEKLPPALREKYALVLAGVGSWKPARFPSGVRLKLLPSVPGGELPALYSGAAAFVFPSLKEGFGYPPLEAMACGCPVASSSASCLPEVLGDACEYFDPLSPGAMAAGITAALEKREELKKKGLARAALYTAEKSAARILSVFEAALTSCGGGN